jgi:hypothetical protein
MFTTRTFHRLLAALGGVALAATLVAPLHAQNDSIRRTLGKHTFLPSTLLGDPFAAPMKNLTGGAGRGLQVPKLNLDEQILEYQDASIGFLSVGMEYQQSLTSWLALRAGFNGGARLGTSGVALLAEGVTAQFGATFGATAKLIRSDRFILSATADVLPGVAYQISIPTSSGTGRERYGDATTRQRGRRTDTGSGQCSIHGHALARLGRLEPWGPRRIRRTVRIQKSGSGGAA